MRELVVPVVCALGMVLALHYFFPGNSTKQEVECSFIAPRKRLEPLKREIDFYDEKPEATPEITIIETSWSHISFSTYGASLDSIGFKRELEGKPHIVSTILPVDDKQRQDRCFILGLPEKTPFYYTLISHEENDKMHQLTYAAANDECVIEKTFFIDKNSPHIDLAVQIEPKSGKHIEIEPRIMFPAPYMVDLKESEIISSIVMDQINTFTKKSTTQLDPLRGWFKPALFGTDSRYFIHALIKDDNHFAQRAYYKTEDTHQLFSILEGPAVTEKTSWLLSFYFGPKELNAIAAVDTRLEKTLDYSGILSSISKLMLYLLNWLYEYLHNYGLAIIALTLLIQLLLLPISLRNSEEKFRQQQMEYQRQLAYVEQRFRDRPEQLAAEKIELMRKYGLPGIGCLIPLLIQLPIFFALSRVLSSSFELYQAPMLWIPDLSQRDPYFVLPVLVTLTMLLQDTKVADAQQRMSKTLMALVFGALTASFSAGLALYIVSSRIFGIIQTRLVKLLS
jgi:YidC/Oxa1 family membrane protein insertase